MAQSSSPTERLHKVLARAGVASRRQAEAMIGRGEVSVNGKIAHIGDRVDPAQDEIVIGGFSLTLTSPRVYYALNKPRGYVTSLRSTHGEQTIQELLPSGPRLFPVGRLDSDTCGLLLLTNDGEWANRVTHPRHAVEKEYEVWVKGTTRSADIERLRHGVPLPGGETTAPARVDVLRSGPHTTALSFTVSEGKKRQIRLMAESIGHPVEHLQRVRIAGILLANLPVGKHRPLTEIEVQSVYV